MNARRTFLGAAAALAAAAALPARAQRSPPVTVYKSPSCGCCGEWVAHMRAAGFAVAVHELADVTPIKRRHAVPDRLASCHTALVAGYVIEGHVPAADVQRLLRERPAARGLAVPGMVPGSPGMSGRPEPYQTLAFQGERSWVYQQH